MFTCMKIRGKERCTYSLQENDTLKLTFTVRCSVNTQACLAEATLILLQSSCMALGKSLVSLFLNYRSLEFSTSQTQSDACKNTSKNTMQFKCEIWLL